MNPFLQVDLSNNSIVTAIATQGVPANGNIALRYKLNYSCDGITWFEYQEGTVSATHDISQYNQDYLVSSVKLPLNLHCTIQIDWLGMINDHTLEYFKWEYLVYYLDIHVKSESTSLKLNMWVQMDGTAKFRHVFILRDTAISIYVVESKLQGYGTRPKGGMGRLELILGFWGCRREMDMEAENTISIALRVLTKSNKNRYDSY